MALISVPSELLNVAVTSAVPAFIAVSLACDPDFSTVTTSGSEEVHVISGAVSSADNTGVNLSVRFLTSPVFILSSVPSLKLTPVITVCSGASGVVGSVSLEMLMFSLYSV